MIYRVIRLLSNNIVPVCLVLSVGPKAFASHTIRNGGGDAELEFVKTWNTLEQKLSACLHAEGPCGLDAKQKQALKSLLANKSAKSPAVDGRALYSGDGKIKSSEEMTVLALALLGRQACEAQLIAGLDLENIAREASRVEYFSALESENGTYVVQTLRRADSSTFTVTLNSRKLDLLAVMREKYGRLMGVVKISPFRREFVEGKLEISGRVRAAGAISQNFMISIPSDLSAAGTLVYLD